MTFTLRINRNHKLILNSTILLTILLINCSRILAKSLTASQSESDSQSQFQHYIAQPKGTPAPVVETVQLSNQNGDANYPQFPEDENIGSYDYHSSSSEEMMPVHPVKNSEYVPVESIEDYNNRNSTNGYIPQRQVSLQDFWQQYHNSMVPQQGNMKEKEVEDEGSFEVVTGKYPVVAPEQYPPPMQQAPVPVEQHQFLPPMQQVPVEQHQSYYQDYQNYQFPQLYHEELITPVASPTPSIIPPTTTKPSTPKISKVAKLIVEAGRNGDGKIAVVKDKLRASRQKRSMMTLSREDENDSEYDDVNSGEKVKAPTKGNGTEKVKKNKVKKPTPTELPVTSSI